MCYKKILFALLLCSDFLLGQGWKPAVGGVLESYQWRGSGWPSGFDIKFKPNGPLNRDWIYGHWLDSDSIIRCVGYRSAGRWVPLPFSVNRNSWTGDIVQYGDTMYIGGYFDGILLDKDSSSIPFTTLLKYHKDSLWRSNSIIAHLRDFEVSGDSLLVLGDLFDSNFNYQIGPHIMSLNGGLSWLYPYSIPHPGNLFGIGGRWDKIRVKDRSIYCLNFAESKFDGVVRWDGQQWHSFGPGIFGFASQVYDFTFYKSELYIAGSFTKSQDSRNPGNCIASWNGSNWMTVGGGSSSSALSLFEHDSLLYCHGMGNQFGDATIPYLAAWNGHQWCGTPINYVGGDPPVNFGFINDTLYSVFAYPAGTANGSPLSYINYFDGDYLHGPNSICSTLGIGEEEHTIEKTAITIYPNPSNGILNISLLEKTFDSKVSIYNLSGQLIFAQELSKAENQLKLPKDLSGLYLVVVERAGQVFTEKVLFESK